jgi:hypothetical protein
VYFLCLIVSCCNGYALTVFLNLDFCPYRNCDAYTAVMWLRNNKDDIRFKHADKVYEPIMLHLNVDSDFAVQVFSISYVSKGQINN